MSADPWELLREAKDLVGRMEAALAAQKPSETTAGLLTLRRRRTMTNAELLDLLREARKLIHTTLDINALREWACESDGDELALDDLMYSLRGRIDAALAERQDSAKDVVESDTAVAPPETEWWSLSQQEADIGRVHLRVWRANAREWHWTVWKRLPSSEGNSGKCATESEAKSAAIAAARRMK